MLTSLTLKRAPAAVREPVAWFHPERRPGAVWLEEITAWPCPAEAVGFISRYRRSGRGRTAGVLAVPACGTTRLAME